MLRATERRARQPGKRHRAGFTLIETALATIIVGVGVLAMVSAQAAFHKKNAWSTNASIAMALGNEIREMTWNLPQRDPVTGDAFWTHQRPARGDPEHGRVVSDRPRLQRRFVRHRRRSRPPR
ncbi:MAG: type IV pilus modification PilV family protein [Planctomycetota bacterium]